jgi:predicted alpha/beta superfamily hydrolase
LVDDVIPTVEGRYPVDDRRRAVAGFSFSGLFGLYLLFHRPEVFSSYLVGSPSLWWDDGRAFGWEEAWARSHDDLAARVFLSIGSNEVLVEGKNEALVAGTWKNENLPLETIRSLARYQDAGPG